MALNVCRLQFDTDPVRKVCVCVWFKTFVSALDNRAKPGNKNYFKRYLNFHVCDKAHARSAATQSKIETVLYTHTSIRNRKGVKFNYYYF